jgi:hypothetical protein
MCAYCLHILVVCILSAHSLHIVCIKYVLNCEYSLLLNCEYSLQLICIKSAWLPVNIRLCRVCAWLQRPLEPTHLPRQGQELGGDPPEPDLGLHWDDRAPCPFFREEGEAFCTYVSSDMSRCHPKRSRLIEIIVCPTQTLSGRLSDPLHGPSKPPLAFLCRHHAHSVHTQCTLYAHLWHTLQT